MEGQRISAKELKARWAHGEMWRDRWREYYSRSNPEKIRPGAPFDELTPVEKRHLEAMLSSVRETMAPELDRFEVYACQSWTKDQLGRTWTIADVSPDRRSNIPLLSYLACPRFDEFADPRVQADRVPFDAPFEQTEPVIVLPYGQMPILIEGYLRAVLFMRFPNPDAKILVWFPIS